jgi:hypothetical protein
VGRLAVVEPLTLPPVIWWRPPVDHSGHGGQDVLDTPEAAAGEHGDLLGGGSLSMGTIVLWAKAPVAIAVSSASVSIGWFSACSPFEIRYPADDAHLERHPPYDL